MTTATPYGKVGAHLANAEIDFVDHTIKLGLLGAGYSANLDTHEFWSDVSASEVSGTGYSAGGAALGTKTTTYISADNQTAHKCAAIVWNATGGSLTAAYAVLYRDTGTTTTSPLIGLIDFQATLTATNANFTITPDSTNGILKL